MDVLKALIRFASAAAPHIGMAVEATLALLAAAKRLKNDDGTDITPVQVAALWADAKAEAKLLGDEARASQARLG